MSTVDRSSQILEGVLFEAQFWTAYQAAMESIKGHGVAGYVPANWATTAGIKTSFTKEFLDHIYLVALAGMYPITTQPLRSAHAPLQGSQALNVQSSSAEHNFASSYDAFFAGLRR